MFIETEERITAAYIFYSWTKNNSNNRYTSMKLEQLELAKSRAMPPCVPAWSMCHVYAPTCLPAWFMCQRDKSVSTSHFYVPTCHTACHFFILACQRANKGAKFFKHFCYQVLRKISILYYYIKNSTFYSISVIHIICICIVNKNCIIIYLYTACHIKEKCMEFFFFSFFLFCSLVVN